ncbi:MAG: hypothetical protein O2781_03825 [Bacteroidetes bacterium]|nr:hypothetical protein [Bacteroidota bacterium]
MKKTILLLSTTIMLSGCVSLHSGYMTGIAPPVENNFKYVGNALGTSQATYILGIGGFNREGLVREAKNNLIKNNPVKDGETLVNFTIDQERSFYLGIVWTHKVIVTADILQYQK